MGSDQALQMLADVLWNALSISGPLLAVTLAVGLLMSVMQVITQIQETSLQFIPKIIAAVLVLVVCGAWRLKRLVAFSVNLIGAIPGYF